MCLMSSGIASAADITEIRVGAINSITGSNAMNGAEQRFAYEQAVADVNKRAESTSRS